MKKVLLITAGFVHPPILALWRLRQCLSRLEGFQYERINSFEKLPDDLESYSAVVIYLHHKEISADALQRFDEYILNGGGVLGIHSATASFKQQEHYFDILGGKFIGHGKVETITFTQKNTSIFSSQSDFRIVDEIYYHDFRQEVQTHFAARVDGEETPLVWSMSYGKGRVCYAMPGHTSKSIQHPAVQDILRQGLKWVCAHE